MTAEVVLMNKQAVAMAADSAGTIGGKIFNSNNKLFMLTKCHPIGIMIYSSAEIMGYPWETIIKVYRERNRNKSFDYLVNYVDDFINFLQLSNLFDQRAKDNYIKKSLVFSVMGISEEIKNVFPKPKEINNKVLKLIITKMLDARAEKAKQKAINTAFDLEKQNQILEPYKKEIIEFISSELQEYNFLENFSEKVYEMAKDSIFCNPINMGSTGIVISGFGKKEVFPVTEHFEIFSIFDSTIQMTDRVKDEISIDNGATIIPFAQKEMVSSFVEGINPKLYRTIRKKIAEIFKGVPEIVTNSVYKRNSKKKQDLRAGMQKAIKEMQKSFFKSLEQHINEEYVNPIIEGVVNLPTDELAMMAETLVNLTSFKRRVAANERETVGGPIDVAVITKGDGFIWIKRKHYFDSDKNHHFFTNYYNEEEK